jgi:hypothetical protein
MLFVGSWCRGEAVNVGPLGNTTTPAAAQQTRVFVSARADGEDGFAIFEFLVEIDVLASLKVACVALAILQDGRHLI